MVESQTSISCVEGSPARTYPRPERAAASKESARGSGASSPEWFASYDPASSSWRTSPRSEDEVSIVFSGTWPRAGTMRRGTACPQRPSAPLTAATGSSWSRGAYPTPSAASYGSSQNEGLVPHARPSKGTPSLETWARGGASWPTPTASMATPADIEPARYAGSDPRRPSYSRAKRAGWATPLAHDARGGRGERSSRRAASRSLAREARRWPTPTAGDSRSSGSRARGARPSRAHPGTSLTDASCRSGPPTPTTCSHGGPCRPQLNPRFVEWLMSFPIEFSACEPSATQLSLL